MGRPRCWAFTSSPYWFRVIASGLVRGGDLSILSDAWVVGLGTGFKAIPKVLSGSGDVEEVTGVRTSSGHTTPHGATSTSRRWCRRVGRGMRRRSLPWLVSEGLKR